MHVLSVVGISNWGTLDIVTALSCSLLIDSMVLHSTIVQTLFEQLELYSFLLRKLHPSFHFLRLLMMTLDRVESVFHHVMISLDRKYYSSNNLWSMLISLLASAKTPCCLWTELRTKSKRNPKIITNLHKRTFVMWLHFVPETSAHIIFY